MHMQHYVGYSLSGVFYTGSFVTGFNSFGFSSENGTAYSFGENKMGQLGQGNQTDAILSPAPVRPP